MESLLAGYLCVGLIDSSRVNGTSADIVDATDCSTRSMSMSDAWRIEKALLMNERKDTVNDFTTLYKMYTGTTTTRKSRFNAGEQKLPHFLDGTTII